MKNSIKNKIWYIIPVFLFILKSKNVFGALHGYEEVHPALTFDNYSFHFYSLGFYFFLSIIYFIFRDKMEINSRKITIIFLLVLFILLISLFLLKMNSYEFNC